MCCDCQGEESSTIFQVVYKKIISAGLSLIFVRTLIFIYTNQFANVRLDGIFSDFFKLLNGVRQGAILSAIFYCIYVNDLFKILRKNKLGCWVDSGQHLGVHINSQNDGLRYDMKIKRAQYITKNNELNQEFSFCHLLDKFHLNHV